MTSCAKATQQIAQDAFDEFISEVVEDLEVCFFTPAGKKRVFREANKHVLISTKLWVEVDQFKTAFDDGGGVYEHFVLLAPVHRARYLLFSVCLTGFVESARLNRPWPYRQLTSAFRPGADAVPALRAPKIMCRNRRLPRSKHARQRTDFKCNFIMQHAP